jgi:hypothetical protein
METIDVFIFDLNQVKYFLQLFQNGPATGTLSLLKKHW